jgi:TPR repeat protein
MFLKFLAINFYGGDMLAWGVCVDKDPMRGIYFMHQAAEQGLSAGLEQLGRYYSQGKLFQQDRERGVILYVRLLYLDI